MQARVALRTRLVALYAGVFVASMSLVLVVSYLLLAEHLRETLLPGAADPILNRLATQYLLALIGTTLFAVAVGWLAARRLLAPIGEITATARRASEERLDERVALGGPADELRELGDTLDAMLDRFQASIEAQRRFIANASHELRSPLTAIRTEVEVTLTDPNATDAELRRMGERVLEAGDELDDLLASLMVLARSQRGLAERGPVELVRVVEAAAGDVAAEAAQAGVVIETELAAAGTVGDPALLRRLVANLIENGVRYNRPGGRVDVRLGTSDGAAVIEVENTGPRVPADAQERLREPFERLARHGGGSGLGLSIVQAVAEAHDGTVSLTARPEGGLNVRVRLPAAVRLAVGLP